MQNILRSNSKGRRYNRKVNTRNLKKYAERRESWFAFLVYLKQDHEGLIYRPGIRFPGGSGWVRLEHLTGIEVVVGASVGGTFTGLEVSGRPGGPEGILLPHHS